jgi:hypothetical protein
MKIFNKNSRIQAPFLTWVFGNTRGWKYIFCIGYNPLLMIFINVILYFDWCSSAGKFKAGDKVAYNFFARVFLANIYEVRSRGLYTVISYDSWDTRQNCVNYVDENNVEGSASSFWLKLAK